MLLALSSFGLANISAAAAAQSGGWLRYAICFIFVTAVLDSYVRISTITHDGQQASLIGMFLAVWLLHVLQLLLLEKVCVPNTGSVCDRLVASYKTLYTARLPDRKANAPHSAGHSSATIMAIRQPFVSYWPVLGSFVDSRTIHRIVFVGKKVFSATAIYIVNATYMRSLTAIQTYALGHSLFIHDLSPTKQHILRRLGTSAADTAVTQRECILRAWSVVHFVWTEWATLTFLHSVLAIVFVGVLCVDDPEEWPPFFGSPLQTYTLQRFWARFWHKAARRAYTAYGKWLSRRVFSLTASGILDRLVIHGFVFLFSGLIHALVEWSFDVCRWETDIWWFAVNFVAVTVEQSIIRSVGARLYHTGLWLKVALRIFGHLWVFAFMFWSLPNASYPKAYCMSQALLRG